LLQRNIDTANRDFRTGLHVLPQHDAIVHFVDMISSQNQQIFRLVAVDNIKVLQHRISRAFVPSIINPLRGGENVEVLVPLSPRKVPAALTMADERVGFVLGRNAHFSDAAVPGVRKHEVNNPVFRSKMHRRFCSLVGEFFQTAAASTGENHRIGGSGEFWNGNSI